jgi:rplN_bact: ribosomal protein L14
LLEN